MSREVHVSGRAPNSADIQRMQRAVAIVTSYDMGTEDNDFKAYMGLIEDEEHPEAMMHALAQFSWLMLQAMDQTGMDKTRVLDWYGRKFAVKCQELQERDQ